MLISDLSVKRPVFAAVVSLLLLVFGFLAYQRLPLREYPDIDTPIVTVKTNYIGAAGNVVETKITQIIEGSVSGIEGLKTIESTSEDGLSTVTLEFDINRDIDEAANDVRDRISGVADDLPEEADPSSIEKKSSSGVADLILGLFHPSMSQMELTDYADRYLVDRLSVIDGVADAQIFGEKRFSMRIWLKRKELAARGITVNEVENALKEENVELPAGRLESTQREFTLRVKRGYRTPAEFRDLIITRGEDGHPIRLGDVAQVKVEPETLRDSFSADGNSAVGIGISRQSTANTLAMIKGVKAEMEKIRPSLPQGMQLVVLKDSSIFIDASIKEVFVSLIIAACLVVAIVFVFLGSFRAALVPAVTVPISLVSAFIVLYLLHFSVNLLTLLALVLAIGLVVDDSIVVVENIYRRIEEGEPALLAAYLGTREVSFAVIATTLVLLAVFVPITLLEGDTGKLFTEFAFAIGGAVTFSSLVALTLSPMICSRILKPRNPDGFLARMDEAIFKRLEAMYESSLKRLMKHPFLSLAILALFCGTTWILMGRIQAEFEPLEDRAVLMLRMTAPEGTGFDAASAYMKDIEKVLNPLLENGEARHILSMVPGGSRNKLGTVNSGIAILELDFWDSRKRSAALIARDLFEKVGTIPGIRAFVIQPSGLASLFGQPVQFVIGGSTYEELVTWRDIIVAKARDYPGLIGVDADYKETTPQLRISVDHNRAAQLGVSSKTIGRTLETFLGSREVTTYIDNGEEYDVILQGLMEERRTPTDLQNIYVKSIWGGDLIPLSNLVTLEERADAGSLNRYNRIRSITISGTPAKGFALGDSLSFLEETVRKDLPSTATVNFKGMSLDFKESGSSVIFVFLLAMVIAYLVLAAQFESFVSPLVIMLTVPMGLFGAMAGLLIMGATLNIYSEIGLIMLIGLAAKNGILIVEFANQLRDAGMDFDSAVYQASRQRLRPIAMTGLSTAIGAVPLLMATGAGAISRIAVGSVIFFGATTACILTMFVVPIGYYYLSRSQASPKELERKLAEMEKAH
ncbi:MAG: efflux RND transporter permease subunit [Pseudomonadota bacterium]